MDKNVINVIANAMLDKKAKNVVSLDLKSIGTAITDTFIICNADSTTAVAAIADNVLVKMEQECGQKVLRMQGLENNFWIILDYGDVVAHIFLTEYRDFYRIEALWADAPCSEHVDLINDVKEESVKRTKTKASSKVRASVKKLKIEE